MLFNFTSGSLQDSLRQMQRSWSWILTTGIVFIVLGVICMVADQTATFATMEVFGWLLIIGAIAGLIHMFRAQTWQGVMLYLVSALFRGVVGYMLVRYPSAGATALTLLLASFFVVGGLYRTVIVSAIQFPGWGWSIASGILSVALGVLLLIQLPQASQWFIGLAIGIELVFDGIALASFGLAIHRLPEHGLVS